MAKHVNLTDFEKKMAERSKTLVSDDATPEDLAGIDRMTADAVARIKDMKPTIPTPKTLADLTPEKRNQVIRDLQGIVNKLPDAPEPAEVVVPMPAFQQEVKAPEFPVLPREEIIPDETVPQVHTCPNCSWDINKSPSAIEDIDKYAWLRATLANKTFVKEFDLFNGKLKVKFRMRTKADMELIREQITNEANLGLLPSTPINLAMIAYNDRLRKLSMAASLVSMTGYKRDLPEISSKECLDLYKEKIDERNNVASAADRMLFANWNEALYSVVFKQFLLFDDLCFRLAEASTSPDFWKEIDARV